MSNHMEEARGCIRVLFWHFMCQALLDDERQRITGSQGLLYIATMFQRLCLVR